MTNMMIEWFKKRQRANVPTSPTTLVRPKTSAALMIPLEPRIMFDGAAVATAADTAHTVIDNHAPDVAKPAEVAKAAELPPPVAIAPPAATQVSESHNVLFVDSRVADSEQLLTDVAKGTEIVYLDRNSDGLAQIAAYLDAHANADSIQIIAHGNTGDLWLGNTYLSSDNIASHADELAAIGKDIKSGGDILIYACNTAAGDQGLSFIDSIANLTGRDVAASSNRTGANTDWDLEIATGTIETTSVLAATSEATYNHDLSLLTVTSNADSGATTLRGLISSATAGDTITFNAGMTITLSSGQLVINKNLTIDGDLDNDGSADVTLNANYKSRVLQVQAGNTVTLDGLILTHGLVAGNGGDAGSGLAAPNAFGGGIWNAGTLTILNTSVTANAAAGGGGGGGNFAYDGGGGGGGGALGNGIGGTGGESGVSNNLGVAGSTNQGGRGGADASFPGMGGQGGNSTGGAGGSYLGYSPGGAGGTANNGSISIGGGGGGLGTDATGGAGGSAAGGIYNAVGGTINVIGTSIISNNLGAGGGGGGGGAGGSLGNQNGGAGGRGVGAVWNKGTFNITATNNSAMTGNAAGSGDGGQELGTGSPGNSPVAVVGIYNDGGSLNTSYNPNAAPVATTSGGTTAFTEGNNVTSTPVVIDSGITITDSDNSTLASGTVSITGGFQNGQDVLAFTNNPATMGNISGTYTAGTGILSLSSAGATATLAQWQAAMRSVTYTNSSDSPNTSNRTLSFVVNDGTSNSTAGTKTVSVTSVNDTPIATASGGTTAFTEGNNVTSTPVVIDSSITVTDLDSTTLSTATVSITGNFQTGEDVLAFTNNPATMGNITGSYTAGTGILSLSSAGATATLAQWQAALRSVTYTNSSDSPNTSNRTISFAVNDGSTTSTTTTTTISVASTNDTPVSTTSGGNTAFTEGNNTTSTPVAVDSGFTVTDGDNSTLASATVAITGNLHTSEDSLAFTNNPATMGNITGSYTAGTGVLSLSSAGATATLAQWQAALRSITYSNSSETPNTSNRTISFTTNDGTADGNTSTKIVTVASVNDSPIATASGGTTAFTEGANVTSTPVVIDSGITLSDVDSTTFATGSVSITGNFQSGEDVLAFTNNPATMGNITGSYTAGTGVLSLSSAGATATLAQWQAALRSVTYTNSSDSPNTSNRTISFVVNDGNSNSTASTKTISVASVNDVPVDTASGGNTTFVQGNNVTSTPVAIDSGFTVSDPDNSTLASATVAVTGNFQSGEDVLDFTNNPATMGNISASYNAGTGVLTLSSAGATATTAQWQAALRSVTYTDTAITVNTSTRTISFTTNDGTADGNTTTKSVTVTATDQSPIGTASGGTTAFTEGANVTSTPVVIDSGLTLSDTDNTTLASATVSITGNFHTSEDVLTFTNNPATMGNITGSYTAGTGVLSLSSAGATATLAQWQAALRSVTYTNSSDSPNTSNRTISFVINDGNSDSNPTTKTVSVASVNDTPVSTTSGGNTAFTEGNNTTSTPVVIDSGFTVSDPDNTTLASSTVAITGNFHNGEDVLAFTNNPATMGNISGSYNSSTGVLSLSSAGATATKAQWQAALQSVTYTNTSDTPDTSNRTISFTTNDGTADGNTATKTVTVSAVNDTPFVTASGGTTAATENIAIAVDTGITLSDVDSTTLASATVSITGNLHTSEDVLTFTNNPATMGNISGSYNSGTGVMTLASSGATATLAQWQAALRSVTYNNTSDTPNTGNRTISFVVNDGATDSTATTKTVSVTAVNDAPVNSGPATQTFSQDTNLIFNTANGNLISVSDADSAGGVERVTLTATHGLITLSGTSGLSFLVGSGTSDATVTFEGTLSDINNALNGLTFAPTSGYNGSASLQIVSNDLGLTGTGGAKTDTDTINLTISPLNPNVTNVSSSTVNGSYKVGDTISLTVALDQVVNVDTTGGTPTLLLETGTVDRNATYVSGSGTNTLTFSYTVQAGDNSSDLDYQSTAAFVLNGATIKNVTNDDAILTLPSLAGVNSIAGQKAIVIDGVAPTVSSVSVPGNATYVAGQNLDFTVNLSENVVVDTTGGTPRIAITLDTGGTVYASYLSGSGTSSLVFRTTVTTGQMDINGLNIANNLDLNGGTLRDNAGNNANTTLNNIASSSGVYIDAIAPTVTSVDAPLDGSYNSLLNFRVHTSEDVVVDTTGGTPCIALDIGGSTVYANYIGYGVTSSELIFQYSVQPGDNDLDGITVGSLSTNGGTLRDAAGNNMTLTLNGVGSTANVLVDTTAPTVTSIVRSDTNPNNSNVVSYLVTFSEALNGGVDASDFNLSLTGTTTGSVVSVSQVNDHSVEVSVGNITGTGSIGLNLNTSGTGIIDKAGNLISGGLTGQVYSIDRDAPTANILVADATLKIGETSQVTITFNEAVTGFTNSNLSAANGTLSTVTSNDGGITWTTTFTPNADVSDTTNLITLNHFLIQDALGNTGVGTTDSNNYAIDTLRPTATILVADTSLAIGETSAVTITFSEAVTGFTNADLTIANGTLSTVSSSDGGITWTATFTPTTSITDTTNVITLDNTGVQDAAGNTGTGSTDSNNYAIDTLRPTASIVVADTALAAGETSLVTITFNEAVTGFTNADLTIANGTLSAVSSSDGGITWTATFTPTTSITDTTNVITLDNTGVQDAAGNTGTGTTDSNNYAIDTVRPTAIIVVADTALAAGETSLVTITFSEAVSNFNNGDLSVSNGSLSNVSSSDGGITWTATLTPNANVTDTTNLITLANTGVTDAAGNTGTGSTDSNNYAIDTLRPSAIIVVADNALAVGETSLVTITFNEAVTGLTNADLTIANGTLSPVSSVDGGITWTATFTPTAAINDTTNVISLDESGVQDAAGNTGSGISTSNNYVIDTVRPTASIVVGDNSLIAGETSPVTITFSEAVTGFTNADLTIANGTLSAVSSADGGITWTATFTPTANLVSTANVITLANTGVQDLAGNTGTGTTDSNNYQIDTIVPTVSSVNVPVGITYNAGDVLTFTVNTSEAVLVNTAGGKPQIALDIGGTTVYATYIGGSNTTTLVFQYTVKAGDNDANGITVVGLAANNGTLRDAAGNNLNLALNNIGSTAALNVDTVAPTFTSQVQGTPNSYDQNINFLVNFSEAVENVDIADFTLVTTDHATATLGSLTQVDNHSWLISVKDIKGNGTVRIDLNAANDITDSAGNALTGSLTGGGGFSALPSPVLPIPNAPQPLVSTPVDAPTPTHAVAPLIVLSPDSTQIGGATNITPLTTVEPPALATFVTVAGANPIVTSLDTSTPGTEPIGVATATSSGTVNTASTGGFTPLTSGGNNVPTGPARSPTIERLNTTQDSGLQGLPVASTVDAQPGVPLYIPLPGTQSADVNQHLSIELRLQDGKPIPSWLRFDPVTGTLVGQAPKGFEGKVNIQVIVRDSKGNSSSSAIELNFNDHGGNREQPGKATPGKDVNKPGAHIHGKPGLNEQFALYGKAANQVEHDALLDVLNQLSIAPVASVPEAQKA